MEEKRRGINPWDIGFGALIAGGAIIALLFWFPHDIKGKYLETSIAGKLEPGDAFFPVLLATLLLALGVLQMLFSLLNRPPYDPDNATAKLTLNNFKFLAQFTTITIFGLALMYWLGPVVTGTLRKLGAIDQTYRQLVDTPPYKYIGYVVGGFVIAGGLITWVEGKVRPKAIFIVIAVIAAAVLIIDTLLINVQLPPNADY